MEKEKFYIFLDIDGTLYTQNDIHEYILSGKPIRMSASYWPNKCNDESRDAFNKLVNTLEEYYDVEIVIISQKRENMELCEEYLRDYGLNITKELKMTPFIEGPRAKKIIGYIKENSGKYPKTKNQFMNFLHRKNITSKYVIIDDDTSAKEGSTTPLSDTFDTDTYIQVDGIKASLTMSQINNYLASLGLLQPEEQKIQE